LLAHRPSLVSRIDDEKLVEPQGLEGYAHGLGEQIQIGADRLVTEAQGGRDPGGIPDLPVVV